MVSLLFLEEFHVILQFELVLSCMQTTSQSPVTQLTKPKFFWTPRNERTKCWSQDHLNKMKILHAGHNSQPRPVTTINGYNLEICNDFVYLSVSTKAPLNVVQEKIGQAWFAIGKLRPIFISQISDASKMRLFKATVQTIAAYGLESVPMMPSLCRQINSSHR